MKRMGCAWAHEASNLKPQATSKNLGLTTASLTFEGSHAAFSLGAGYLRLCTRRNLKPPVILRALETEQLSAEEGSAVS